MRYIHSGYLLPQFLLVRSWMGLPEVEKWEIRQEMEDEGVDV